MSLPRASAVLGALTSGFVRLSLRHPGGPHFLSLAKATKVEPGNAEGTALVRIHNDRAGLRVGDLHTRMCGPSRGGFPRHSFRQSPQDFSGDCIQTHEAGASVPSLSAMAGATLHTIPVAGCPASLPPELLEVDYLAHRSVSLVSVRRGSETIRELFCAERNPIRGGGKIVRV